MMFSAGMGIGLMFYGVTEPVTHLMTPPEAGTEPGTDAAAGEAMNYALFHWGLHPWAIYAVVGLALAYSSYRKGGPEVSRPPSRPCCADPVGPGPPAPSTSWPSSRRSSARP